MVTEDELGRLGVAVIDPGSQAGHVIPDFAQKALAVDCVESVREVELDKHLTLLPAVAEAPLSSDLKANLRAKRLRDPDLQRPQVNTSLLLEGCAHAFSSKAAQDIANGDGPRGAILFG